jgi:hypothetical protein
MEKFFVTEARDLSDGILSGKKRVGRRGMGARTVYVRLQGKLMINLSALQHTRQDL